MAETALVSQILVALSAAYPDAVWYRRNTGAAYGPGGYMIRFGLPGMADISGIVDGQAFEIEAKFGRGQQRPEQKDWQAAVTRAGGVYILARSVQDALDGVRNNLR